MSNNIFENLLWLILAIVYLFTVRYQDTVVFFDVGQGDATLIQKGSIQVVIDGGPDDSILYEIHKYVPIYDRKIEYLILTHPHEDHIVGLLHVLERYEVEEVLYYPVCYENKNYEFLLQEYSNLRAVGKGETIWVDDIEIEVLWPILPEDIEGCIKSYNGNINNDSLAIELEYLNKRFLLMGDLEEPIEKILIEEGIVSGEYDILKAGHHCSKTSSSETFIKGISPPLAICSVGKKNIFGHPSSETLEIFDLYNVQHLLTYEEGNIQIK